MSGPSLCDSPAGPPLLSRPAALVSGRSGICDHDHNRRHRSCGMREARHRGSRGACDVQMEAKSTTTILDAPWKPPAPGGPAHSDECMLLWSENPHRRRTRSFHNANTMQ
uniref:Uncharacterized protein n=1 Tax=Eutreptiella gymnastica TaxID=73025 RepID=A0A7S4CUB4_9EUGL